MDIRDTLRIIVLIVCMKTAAGSSNNASDPIRHQARKISSIIFLKPQKFCRPSCLNCQLQPMILYFLFNSRQPHYNIDILSWGKTIKKGNFFILLIYSILKCILNRKWIIFGCFTGPNRFSNSPETLRGRKRVSGPSVCNSFCRNSRHRPTGF